MKQLLLLFLTLAFPLLAEVKILVFAGSTREDSYNKKLASEAAEIAKKMGAKVTLVDLKDYPMPFYDADLEASVGMPKEAKQLRDLMVASDAILIASPEYNGSSPGLLKNTLDWASRGEDGNFSRVAFKGKKFAIVSASPGGGGGARGLTHLRALIEEVGGSVEQKQVSIPKAHQAFNDKGALESAKLRQDLTEEVKQLF